MIYIIFFLFSHRIYGTADIQITGAGVSIIRDSADIMSVHLHLHILSKDVDDETGMQQTDMAG